MGLSKSRFIAGLQCLKRFYWEVHQPELAGEPDEQSMAVFEQGYEVGRWAQRMFPGGALIEAGREEMDKALRQTEQAVADRQHPAIFEATFTHDNILARVDILERLPRNKWRLIEVKSSTSLKDYYLYDVAIQRLILEGLGMKVAPCLMHLNREYVYDGKQWFGKGLKEALAGLRYPLYFMDFETLAVALPRYAGMSPYDQIPFQWSVHVQRKPGTEPEHFEFLADGSSDPRPEFVKALCKVIGKKGTILAYNGGFESGCLASLAEELNQYKDEIGNIQGRLWDLLPVIRAHVYDLAFRGSYSLKSVLPALVPDMSYDGMEVAEGNDAGLAWEKMVHAEAGTEERRRLKEALLAYCRQDTLAMVRLLEVLQAA